MNTMHDIISILHYMIFKVDKENNEKKISDYFKNRQNPAIYVARNRQNAPRILYRQYDNPVDNINYIIMHKESLELFGCLRGLK